MSSLFLMGINNHENVTIQHNQNLITQPNNNQQSTHLYRQKQMKQNKLLIDPQNVYFNFQFGKSLVNKLTLKNQFPFKIAFKIIQPKKTVLNVKSKKLSLNPKQNVQIFVFFNGQKQKIIIEDQFIILIEKQKKKIHVPITCRPKTFRMSHPKLSLNKISPLQSIQNTIRDKPKPRLLSLAKKSNTSIQFAGSVDNIVNSFMDKFNQIHEFIKEKNVTKQIFIGQKALTREKHNKIVVFNQQLSEYVKNKMKNKIQSRLEAEFSAEGPVVRNFQGLILRWNKQKNIPRIVYEKGLAKMQEQVRKYVVNLRFQKIHRIFSLYRQFQDSNEHNNLPMHKRHEIYVQKLQKKLNKSSQISLQLVFDRNSIVPNNIQIQYKTYSAKKNHIFEINPRIGFDNWVPIQQSIPYTHQIMNYTKKHAIPEWMCHPRLKDDDNTKSESQSVNMPTIHVSYTGNQVQDSTDNFNQVLENIRFVSESDYQFINKKRTTKNKAGSKADLNSGSKKVLTSKAIQSLLSLNKIPEDKVWQISQICDNNQALLQKIWQDNKIQQNFKKITSSDTQISVFYPYISEQQQFNKISQNQSSQIHQFVIKDLSKQRLNSDSLSDIIFAKQDLQPYKECLNLTLMESVYGKYKNHIIRKVEKEDKYEFDRIDEKTQHLLEWVKENDKKQEYFNYRLKRQIQLQIPIKNKLKIFGNQTQYERFLQNIDIHKKNLIGKSKCLQTFLYQSAKNKNFTIFTQ